MGRLIPHQGLELATAVVALAQTMLSDDDQDFDYWGISRNKTCGFHFSNVFENRSCSVLNHPVSDGILFVYGCTEDFAYPEGYAKDNAVPVDFEINEIYEAAEALVLWLTKGLIENTQGFEED